VKFAPKSIAAKLSVLVGLIGLVSLALHIFVLSLLVNPLFEDFTGAVVNQIKLLKLTAEQTPVQTRFAYVESLLSKDMALQKLIHKEEFEERWIPFLATSPIGMMKDALPANIRLRLPAKEIDEPRGTLYFDFEIDKENWRIVYKAQPPVAGLIGMIFGWLGLIATGVSVSLVVGMRWITRPISQIAEQINLQSTQLTRITLPEKSGPEMQSLVHAFNSLADTVKKADADRLNMLAGLSHDLRTPLTRMRLRIETELFQQDTTDLEQDISAMQKIVNQFMAYVHGNSSSELGALKPVSDQIVTIALDYPQLTGQVRLLFNDPDLQLPEIGFRRILSNLIENAITYGKAPFEVTLRSRLSNTEPEAVLSVFDRGAGMTPEQFAKARQPFVRLDSSHDPEIGHCGLGLAIADEMAKQLGGRIDTGHIGTSLFYVSFIWPIKSFA
jgi:two-component system, OmpR family, osmolarity sensor histidine kinase EnvZ